ncbi:hypothetical protein [Streptomyces liangshanensis]|uniref:Uncharacterized protein n=1 Tax=Streptomyces liangshanensis TaxID=2717324 RepID=A0A6G9H093_9ACTN|nr:hypothetical protein [Streptomyces liangshanensis]QIQ03948.1 hypothetical protein HA039_17900 [Streptomyces liangshanensis]
MASQRNSKLPVVTEAEHAVRSAGGQRAMFNQRHVRRGNWFADWAGRLGGSDVYIGITGKEPTARKVRLLLDDWIFEDVSTKDLGGVLTEIFSRRGSSSRDSSTSGSSPSGATIRTKRLYLLFPAQVLKVPVGRSRYSATRKPPPDAELSPWERALLVQGDGPAGGSADEGA